MKWDDRDRYPTPLADMVIVFCTAVNVGLFLTYLGLR